MNCFRDFTAIFSLNSKSLWKIAIGVFLVSIFFALYTNHAWEDWYITYRASKNLALGNGLVFIVGERVHSFTSPLGTLVPALLSFITGNTSDELVLWLYRIICCGLLSLTSVLLLRIAQATSMFNFSTAIMVGLFAFDAKIIDFSINGQETAFMMIFLAALLYALIIPSNNFPVRFGLSCAGLMWTRPDSFIYIGGLVLGFLLFMPESPQFNSRRELSKQILLAGIVALLAYLPWTLWTWYYYGTPIPHTILAKGLAYSTLGIDRIWYLLTQIVEFPYTSVFENSSVTDTFAPIYASIYGGWNAGLVYECKILALICAYYWCLPGGRRLARAVSFAVFVAHLYLSKLTPIVFPWYVPNVAFLSIFVLAQIMQQAMEVLGAEKYKVIAPRAFAYLPKVLYVCGGCVFLLCITMTFATGYEMNVQQEVIENGNRKKVGSWLKEHATSSLDTVFLECLGYIGFYSQLKMLDFPGMSSPEVVAARRKLGTNDFAALIWELQPNWLVLRPLEIYGIEAQMPDLLRSVYVAVEVFDVSDKIDSYANLPGRPYLQFDQTFVVFKKQ